MSDLSYEKSGINPSTFYSQKKIALFPKVRTPTTESTNVIVETTKSSKRCKKHLQKYPKNQQKKSLMSRKGNSGITKSRNRKKALKFASILTDSESMTSCKSIQNNKTGSEVRKRTSANMGFDRSKQSRSCKRIKLDFNMNIESEGKISTLRDNDIECENELKAKMAINAELNLKGTGTINSSCSPNKGGKIFNIDGRMKFENCQKNGHSINKLGNYLEETVKSNGVPNTSANIDNNSATVFGTPHSPDKCEDCLTETFQSCENANINDNISATLFDTPNSASQSYKKLNTDQCENDTIFGTPNLTRRNSLKEIFRNNTRPSFSTRDNLLGKNSSDMIIEAKNDLLRMPNSVCSSENSMLGIVRNNSLSTLTYEETSVENKVQTSGHISEVENDILKTLHSSCISEKNLEVKACRRSPRKKTGSLDAFFSIRTTSKTNKCKDSGFHESLRILGELSTQEEECSSKSSSTNTSPLLFSQNSASSSAKSRAKSTSPDSQSTITKYFTPLMKSTSVSPSSDKKGNRMAKGRKVVSPSNSPASNKKEQMFLDLGQKNFGHITCPTCNMVYTRAQPEDEAHHVKFHHKVVLGLRFKGWKTERIVEDFDDGRVIVVLPQDPPSHLKKVASVRTVVDEELGFSSETSLRMQDSKTYLFIADKKVVGCAVAVVIQEAFRLLPFGANQNQSTEQGAWCCSTAPVRAQCGISRVWVLQQYRRKKIASRMLDCVRNDFMFGGIVSKELMAFSDPTPVGKQLAESYCGTENVLVFR